MYKRQTTHCLKEDEVQHTRVPLSFADLLVVGARGRYGRVALGLESVSRVLLKAARCPVLLVSEDLTAAYDRPGRPVVLAGIGDHASDSAVVKAAWAESRLRDGDVWLLHAYSHAPREEPARDMRRAADVVAGAIDAAGVWQVGPMSVLLIQDTPSGALSRYCGEASLVVLGSRPGSLSGLVMNSVTQAVMFSAPCPVLVIPNDLSGHNGGQAETTSRAAHRSH